MFSADETAKDRPEFENAIFCRLESRNAAAGWPCLGMEVSKICYCGVQVTAFEAFRD
jgi:hypothetical protein